MRSEKHVSFLTDIINCILRDPFIRNKVFSTRMMMMIRRIQSISTHIRLDQFVAVSVRIFRLSLLKRYGSPMYKCFIRADERTAVEIIALRDVLMLTEEQVEVDVIASMGGDEQVLLGEGRKNVINKKSPANDDTATTTTTALKGHTDVDTAGTTTNTLVDNHHHHQQQQQQHLTSEGPEDVASYLAMVDNILRSYLHTYPCSFIIHIIIYEDRQLPQPILPTQTKISKAIIIVDSNEARLFTLETLQELLSNAYPSLHDLQRDRVFDRYLDCMVGHLTEQCNDNLPLKLHFMGNGNATDKVVAGSIVTTTNSSNSNSNSNSNSSSSSSSSSRYVITFPLHKEETGAVVNEVITAQIDPKLNLVSTLSGIVSGSSSSSSSSSSTSSSSSSSSSDVKKAYYVFTTGHYIEDYYSVDGYNVVASIWPSMMSMNSIGNNFYYSKLTELRDPAMQAFMSDITVLKPIDHAFFERASYEEVDVISKYDNGVPVLPDDADMLGIIHYRGQSTIGTMEVIGYGYCSQWFNTTDVSGLLYERFYIAIPLCPASGSELGDSGAYCFKHGGGDDDTQKDRVHSFLIGALGPNLQYRILTPAHFALEQIRKIAANPTLRFMRLVGIREEDNISISNYID
jgi:hypothetical protein